VSVYPNKKIEEAVASSCTSADLRPSSEVLKFLVSVNGLLGKANFCIFLSSLGSGLALSGKE